MSADALLAVVLWGGIYPASKLGLAEIPTLGFTALRLGVATTVLFALSARPTRPRPPWRAVLTAGLAQGAFQLLLIASLARTTAGNSAVLLATAPLMTAGGLALTRPGTVGGRQWGGLALGLSGVALVVGGGVGFASARLAGDLLALAAAAAWAAYSGVIGPLVAAQGSLRATAWGMVVAAGLVTPVAVPDLGAIAWGRVSAAAWGGLLYGSTAGMGAAMALWARAVHRLGPARTMPYVYLEPVSAVLLAALLLGEPFGWVQALGAALALLGVRLAA